MNKKSQNLRVEDKLFHIRNTILLNVALMCRNKNIFGKRHDDFTTNLEIHFWANRIENIQTGNMHNLNNNEDREQNEIIRASLNHKFTAEEFKSLSEDILYDFGFRKYDPVPGLMLLPFWLLDHVKPGETFITIHGETLIYNPKDPDATHREGSLGYGILKDKQSK